MTTIALIALAIGIGLLVLIAVVSLTIGPRDPGGRLSGNRGPMLPGQRPPDDGGDLDL